MLIISHHAAQISIIMASSALLLVAPGATALETFETTSSAGATVTTSTPRPSWHSQSSPGGSSVKVNTATAIEEGLYVIGEETGMMTPGQTAAAGSSTNNEGHNLCWFAMLDSFDDDLEFMGSDAFPSPYAASSGMGPGGFINSKASPSLQQSSSFQQDQNTRCSLVDTDSYHGKIVMLGVEQYLGGGSNAAFDQVFLQIGMDNNNIFPVPTPGMPIGLASDYQNNLVIVALAFPSSSTSRNDKKYQDLYLHAYRKMSSDQSSSSDLLLVWEKHWDNLVSNAKESFSYAGMAISSGILTIVGSTSGTFDFLASLSTPMNKSMMSYYAKFANTFVLQIDAATGALENSDEAEDAAAPSLQSLQCPNDLNEYAYGICQDPNDDNIVYIVGQVVRENTVDGEGGGSDGSSSFYDPTTGVPQVTKMVLSPALEVLWSSSYEELQELLGEPSYLRATGDMSYLALRYCAVSPESGNLFVAGTSSPDLPLRHNINPSITNPEPETHPLFPLDDDKTLVGSPINLNNGNNGEDTATTVSPITCSSGKVYNAFVQACVCANNMVLEAPSGNCYPGGLPCLNQPCRLDQTCEHTSSAPEGELEEMHSFGYRCTGGGGKEEASSSAGITMNSVSMSCLGGKVYDFKECVCPQGTMEAFGRCYPKDLLCLTKPCEWNEECIHIPAKMDKGVWLDNSDYWCQTGPSRRRNLFSSSGNHQSLVPTHIVVAKILSSSSSSSSNAEEVLWSKILDSDISNEELAGLQINDFSFHPIVIGNTYLDDGTSEAFIMTMNSDNGSIMRPPSGFGGESSWVVPIDEEEAVSSRGSPEQPQQQQQPTSSVVCTDGKVFDDFFDDCECPDDQEEERSSGLCYPFNSPCLDQPCSAGKVCLHITSTDDFKDGAYSCRDTRPTAATEDLPPPPDLNDPTWMHQDTKEQFGTPEKIQVVTNAESDDEEDSNTKKILSIVFGVVGGMILSCVLTAVCVKANKQWRMEDNQKRVMNIFLYLHPFDVDDIDIRKSPAGGFLGSYKNGLAHGENGASSGSSDGSSSMGGSNNNEENMQQKLV